MHALRRAAALAASLGLCACAASHATRLPASSPDVDVEARPAAGRPAVRFAMPEVEAAPSPPVTLTTTEGHGLRLESLDSRTRVLGPLAATEVRLVFVNDAPRILEGRFRVALPPRSFASRLAMKVEGVWREADVVETAVARGVYEDTMHERRDPLLVEQRDDNELTARVFPIPAGGQKEILVGWVSETGADAPIVVPLRGLGRLARLDVRVTKGDTELAAISSREDAPRDDLRVPAPAGPSALRAGSSVVARVRVGAAAAGLPEPIGRGLLVLLDTSASQATELEATLGLVRALAARLAADEPGAHLVVAAYDQDVAVVHDGPMGTFGEDAAVRVRARGALGASDLAGALAWSARRDDVSRAIVVGDGMATAGDASRKALRAAVEALAARGVRRLDAIVAGDVRDESVLRALATGGIVAPASVGPDVLAARLRRATVAHVTVAVPGARWAAPAVLDDAQDGDERFVYAEIPEGRAPRVSVGGVETTVAPIASPLAERALAKAKIDAAAARAESHGWDDETRSAVVALARKHKLASPFTSMIVLENDAARAAMETRRPAPSRPAPQAPRAAPPPSTDILAPPPPLPPKQPPAREVQRPTHTPKPASMRSAAVQVNGRVPPEVIQRIVRQGWGRFRGCYLEGYLRSAHLRGRVVTKIVIGRDGSVVRTEDAGSDLPDPRVVRCVVEAFRALVFPANDWGWITVVYPIAFRPAEEDDDDAQHPPAQTLPTGPRPPAARGAALDPPSRWEPPLGWTGTYAWVRESLAEGQIEGALVVAARDHARDPVDATPLAALGEAFEAAGMRAQAARAYGSLADLEPHRADRLRAAAGRLSAIGELPLAVELARRAEIDRPDLPSSYQLLATILLQGGAYEEAFDVLARGLAQRYDARYARAHEALADTLGLVAAAWEASSPARAAEIEHRALVTGAVPHHDADLRLVTTWESDPSRVWPEMVDAAGEPHGWGPVSEGWGPEEWPVLDPPADATLEARILNLPPNGEPTFGVVHVLTHDGRGHVTVDPRPFVLMREQSRAPLGLLRPSSGSRARSPSSRDGS
jgi:hypothetical protein